MNGIELWMAVTGRAPTIPELAGQLGIEHSALLSRLEGLERGGYRVRTRIDSVGEFKQSNPTVPTETFSTTPGATRPANAPLETH